MKRKFSVFEARDKILIKILHDSTRHYESRPYEKFMLSTTRLPKEYLSTQEIRQKSFCITNSLRCWVLNYVKSNNSIALEN